MTLLTKTTSTIALALSLTLGASATQAPTAEIQEPLISYVSEANATGDVKAVYEEIKSTWGIIPEPMKALSLNPKLLRNAWEYYKIEAQNTNFTPILGAMMRMLIAEKNDCDFCIGFNKGMLLNSFKLTEDQIIALQKNPNTAPLPPKEKAMLLFMLKAAFTPHDVNKIDIEGLKKLGWSKTDIMEGAYQATHMVSITLFIDTFKIQ